MKNFYLSLIFTAISFSAFAQDTIYMDSKYQELDTKEGAKYFKIITYESLSGLGIYPQISKNIPDLAFSDIVLKNLQR